ncbi:MAG: response regulator [Pseudanabaenaceae cyanobacterium]
MADKKVLVIDDSIMIRKMVKSILAGRYEVIEASDGKSGIEAAKQHQPDLILLDFVMPKYNGYQTLQAIRKIQGLEKTPVIMISGLRDQVAEHIPEPFVGFEFLEKPFEADVLIDHIERLLFNTAPTPPVPQPVSAAVKAKPTTNAGYAAIPAPAVADSMETVMEASLPPQQPDYQAVIAKITSTEMLLVQGIENLIQREVVARMTEVGDKVDRHEERFQRLEQMLEKILQLIEHQNKGLMVILREVRALQEAQHH